LDVRVRHGDAGLEANRNEHGKSDPFEGGKPRVHCYLKIDPICYKILEA